MKPDWRTITVEPRTGVENMARDAGLLDRARETGEPVFSIYSWVRPTLSFGRNQTANGHYDRDEIARRGIDVVRRPTGGRALLHHREITYSVASPVSPGESLTEAYRRINAILTHGLAKLGVAAAESTARGTAIQPGLLPCFAVPAEGELVSRGSKLVGSAQVRENGALLQHGSILVENDQPLIREVSLAPLPAELPEAATLRALLGRAPTVEEVANALFTALGELEATDMVPLRESELDAFTSRHRRHYENELWTWRR
jgi:lipoate-protein ligase A